MNDINLNINVKKKILKIHIKKGINKKIKIRKKNNS